MKKTKKDISYWKQFRIMIQTIWKMNPLFIILMFADIIISSASTFPAILFPKYIIDALVEGRELSYIIFLITCMVGLSLLFNTLMLWLNNKRDHLSLILGFTLTNEINKKCLEIDYNLYNDINTLDKRYYAYKVVNDNNFVALLSSIRDFFKNLIVLSGIILLTIRIDATILVIALIVITIQTIATSKTTKRQLDYNEEAFPYMRRSEYVSRISNVITFRKDILIYNAKDYVINKLNGYNQFLFDFFKKLKKFQILSGLLGNFVAHIYQFIMYTFLSIKMLNHAITIGDFSLYLGALNTFVNSCNGAIGSVIDIRRRIQYFEAYQDFMNIKSNFRTGKRLLKDVVKDEFVFTFENVSFAYPGQEHYVLKNINIQLRSGEKLAVIGDNGAGKTTFTMLLMRLFDPNEGRILLNGIDIREIDYDEYLKMFGTVFQDFKIFGYSVLENIVFREDSSEQDIQRVNDLLKENDMEERIHKMRNGIHTYLTRELDENGEELSGGEMQKIAIIRAVFKDADFLVMDEPTSALDPNAEYKIYLKFAEMTKGKSAIYISHRLASTHFCDKIAMFDDGQIIEYGTHNELMKNKKKYYHMYSIQSELYHHDQSEE